MRWPYLIMWLGIAAATLVSASAAENDRKCYCRTATGQKLEVGKLTCIKTNKGLREARCGLVLNNTAWIFTGRQCPIADNGGNRYATASAYKPG